MSTTAIAVPSAAPQPIPAASSENATATPDLSSSVGSTRSSIRSTKSTKSSSKLGQTPPYWNRHRRTTSNVSYVSVNTPTRRPPIVLEDHSEEHDDSGQGLWARGVTIDDHHVVSGGAIAAGSYVVWHCRVETLEVSKHPCSHVFSLCFRSRGPLSKALSPSCSMWTDKHLGMSARD